jgi:hypothetical protein
METEFLTASFRSKLPKGYEAADSKIILTPARLPSP